jgi:hypothetical protein
MASDTNRPVQTFLPGRFHRKTGFHRKRRGDESEISNKKKGTTETQHNPNQPGKPPAPGQQGGQQQDRERQEGERQQRERENKVAANRAAASKADDKPAYLGLTSGGRRLPPLLCLVQLQDDQHYSA